MKPQQRVKYLAALAIFLWLYMTISFFLAMITNTGIPFFWVILIVYPSIALYKIAEWLWT